MDETAWVWILVIVLLCSLFFTINSCNQPVLEGYCGGESPIKSFYLPTGKYYPWLPEVPCGNIPVGACAGNGRVVNENLYY